MKKYLAGLLAISATTAAVYAAPGMKADANGDKAVTKAEALAAADARFARMDANGDGALNEADKAARVAQRFAAMDSDKSGSLSQAEFVAAHEARAEKRGERLMRRQADGQQGKQRGRRAGGMKMLARADTNGDKAVSAAEFRAIAEARFDRVDTNRDGTISAEERQAQRGKWRNRAPAPGSAG
jgi:hypothetical protein